MEDEIMDSILDVLEDDLSLGMLLEETENNKETEVK